MRVNRFNVSAFMLGASVGLVTWMGFVFFMSACELHNPPPCDPSTAVWPDPCAAGRRHDASRD